jgi:malonyl-CoA/methylmalonyl-CoA synthetase
MSSSSGIPIIARACRHGGRTAVVDAQGSYSYDDLLDSSLRVAMALLAVRADLGEERVAFLLTPGFPWVATQWGIWRAGGIAVPLPVNSTKPELEYFIDDARAITLICDAPVASLLSTIAAARGIRVLLYDELRSRQAPGLTDIVPNIGEERRAMILYTSGTSSRPKGVVTTHANITAQITSLVESWEWSASDEIPLCLPLHHVHGIINVVSCALWTGATCRMLPRFDANAVWDCIANGDVSLFMAVPTIYVKLIAAWDAASPERRDVLSRACSRLRLMVSGSAALPVSTLQRWKDISGHTLLERYGMTEIGMALSNPLRGERVPGSVGRPLPGVEVRLVGEEGEPVVPGRSKSAAPLYSPNTGASPRPRAPPFATAGFAPAIRRSLRMELIAFWAGRTLTSSRRAGTKSPRWRLRKLCVNIPRWPSVPWWACPMQSGGSASLLPWS